MHDVIVGVVAVLIGTIFCLRGYWAMRVIIPIWGAFCGFLLGAGLVASGTDDGFLRTVLSWMVGLAVAMLFGVFAYLYYEIAIVLAMTSVGFALGTSVMVALGVSWSWAIVLVGVIVGALLAQIRAAERLRTSMRAAWEGSGGRTMRAA